MHIYKSYILPYTICFCTVGEKVLLIKRKKEPYLNKWNGLGGKIEEGEGPKASAIREIMEEAGLDGLKAQIKYCGIITWDTNATQVRNGMYAYIFEFPKIFLFDKREIREGLLEWKEMDWILNKKNMEIAENVKYFLPEMIKRNEPMNYHCEYKNVNNRDELTKFIVRKLV